MLRVLVLPHSVTSTQQSARMAVTDHSSSFGATNNRLLNFEYIMAACSAAMETVQLLFRRSNWLLAVRPVGSCTQPCVLCFQTTSHSLSSLGPSALCADQCWQDGRELRRSRRRRTSRVVSFVWVKPHEVTAGISKVYPPS